MSSSRIYIAILVFLALISAPFVWYQYLWRDTTPRGPLSASSDWPKPIRELHAEMVRLGIMGGPFEVFLVHGRPGDTDSTVICRMPESAQALEFLKAKLGLKQAPVDKLDFIMRVERETATFAPPDWWPNRDANVEYFVSRGILEGNEGDLYVVADDSQQGRLFIHYYFNF